MSRYNVATAPTETSVIPSPRLRPAIAAAARQRRQASAKGWSMEKWLCWSAMGVAGLFLLLFALDFLAEVPFGGLSGLFDGIGIVCAVMLFYIGLNAFRDLRQ